MKTKLDACVSVIEEISSSLITKLDACRSVTEEISSSLKTNLDACISDIEGNVIKEKSQEDNCKETEVHIKTEKEIATGNSRRSNEKPTSYLITKLDPCMSVTNGDAIKEESQEEKFEETEKHMKTEKDMDFDID